MYILQEHALEITNIEVTTTFLLCLANHIALSTPPNLAFFAETTVFSYTSATTIVERTPFLQRNASEF